MARRRRSDWSGRPAMRSPGRPPVARREHRQRFWEAIADGLSSEEAGVVAGVSPAVGSRWFREGGGMRSITRDESSGRCLSFEEREEISILRVQDCGVREIARRLGRAPSTISRELRRNAATRGGYLDYRATTAQRHADRRPSPEAGQTRRQRGVEAVRARPAGRMSPPATGRRWPVPMPAGSGGVTGAGDTAGGPTPGARSRSPAACRSISPMMSR